MKQLRGNLFLIITAFIWGSAFVAQSVASENVEPFTFNMSRSIIGGLFLLALIFILSKFEKKEKKEKKSRKTLIIGGVTCGTVLALASAMQQTGISSPGVTTGKAGFLTAMYILIIPILGLFLKKKVSLKSWISAIIGVVGMYFLCFNGESLKLSKGDIYLILCAVLFSVQVLAVDYFSPKVDGIKLSCIQLFVCAFVSSIFMFLTETPKLNVILSSIGPILYTGVMSSGIAYTLQIIAQKDTNPVVASLLMSLESVFALLCGWIILSQKMNGREIFGCLILFCAIILSQIPLKSFFRLRKHQDI